jgi:hypothetical protein
MEMMDDAMDGAMDSADDVTEADTVYAQICDDIGIDMSHEGGIAKDALSAPA